MNRNAENVSAASGDAVGERIDDEIIFQLEDEERDFRRFFKDADCLKGKVSEVGKKLGEGHHSVVYEGVQFGTGKKIAIKVDERKLEQNYDEVMRKINALKSLHHPNIARLFDFIPGEDKQRSYIIMEYIDGKGLNQELDAERPFPQNRVLNWACQLLDALKYLHDGRHIHGDIRLSNIVLRADASDSVCFCDFSYLLSYSSKGTKPLSNNPDDADEMEKDIFSVLMDDRQFQREKRRDIYYLGSALFQLLTGIVPLKRQSFSEKKAILDRQPGISENFSSVIAKALAENPEERYQSADEMLNDLYALPLKDRSMKRYRWQTILAAWGFSFLMAFGILISSAGQYQTSRILEMSAQADKSLNAMAQANYTQALEFAMNATWKRSFLDPNPALAPGAQAALTKALGAYDLASGYKPLYSNSELRGKPLKVCLSPSGARLAVLMEDTTATPSVKRIQTFDTASGQKTGESLIARNSLLSDFAFRDDDTLLYAGETGLAAFSFQSDTTLWTGEPATDFVLSGDGAVCAAVNLSESAGETSEASSVTLYDPDGGTWQLPFGTEDERKTQSAPAMSTDSDPEDNLLALNQTGRLMAVSFSDGSLRVYRFDSPGKPGNGLKFTDIFPKSQYAHFEGGFYGSYFFYVATNPKSSGATGSEYGVYELTTDENGVFQAQFREGDTLPDNAPIHAVTDENGIYLSHGNSVLQYQKDFQYFLPLEENVNGQIQLLRHVPGSDETPGRVLAITENRLVMIYDDGSVSEQDLKITVSEGVSFNLSAISEEYLILASRERLTFSVLQWKDAWKTNDYIAYDSAFEHLRFSVRETGESAMLYRLNEVIFSIWSKDADNSGGAITPLAQSPAIPDWNNIDELQYLRSCETECLKALYADGHAAYYSALDGQALDSPGDETGENGLNILTDDYRVSYRRGGSVEIRNRKSGKLLTGPAELNEGQLSDATQYGEYLLISLIIDKNELKSYLLNGSLDKIAEIPGAAILLSDGSLYFDDLHGRLIRTRIFSLSDLREQAQARQGQPKENTDGERNDAE